MRIAERGRRRMELAAEHARQGFSRQESADLLGISVHTVSNYRTLAKREGLLPKSYVRSGKRTRHNVPIGKLAKAMVGMDAEVSYWIGRQLPEGGTIAEFAVACMIDAYHEDAGAAGGKDTPHD